MQPQPSVPRFVPYFVPDDPADAEATESARLTNLELSEAKAAADEANNVFSPAYIRYSILYEQSMLKNSLAASVAREKRIHLASAPPQPQPQPQPQQSLFWNKVSNSFFPFMGGRTKRSKRSKKHSKRSKRSKRSNRKGLRRSRRGTRKHF